MTDVTAGAGVSASSKGPRLVESGLRSGVVLDPGRQLLGDVQRPLEPRVRAIQIELDCGANGHEMEAIAVSRLATALESMAPRPTGAADSGAHVNEAWALASSPTLVGGSA